MDRCKRDHKYTRANTGWAVVKGRNYRFCKTCKVDRYKAHYRCNEEFRQRKIKGALKFYYKKKAEKHGLAEVS